MRIAESGIRNEEALLFACPFCKAPCAKLLQELSCAGLQRGVVRVTRKGSRLKRERGLVPLRMRIAVDDHVA